MNAIIFDFDGTIADSFDQITSFLLSTTGRKAGSLSPADRQSLRGLPMKQLALRIGVPAWRLPLVYFRGKWALTEHMYKTPVFPGVNEVLAALHADNYQLYIVSSNSKRNIERFLAQHGLSGYFTRIYGNVGYMGKAGALKRALNQNQLLAKNTVYVGDEVRDVVAANAVGMAAAAVNWGFGSEAELLKHSPTIIARTPAELQKSLLDWGRIN